MMNKILLLILLITPSLWAAEDPSEDAIILNQELQFLEEMANTVTINSATQSTAQNKARPIETKSLESQYFGNDLEDEVETKVSSPKRRALEY